LRIATNAVALPENDLAVAAPCAREALALTIGGTALLRFHHPPHSRPAIHAAEGPRRRHDGFRFIILENVSRCISG
jgi:hypothetical protein